MRAVSSTRALHAEPSKPSERSKPSWDEEVPRLHLGDGALATSAVSGSELDVLPGEHCCGLSIEAVHCLFQQCAVRSADYVRAVVEHVNL